MANSSKPQMNFTPFKHERDVTIQCLPKAFHYCLEAKSIKTNPKLKSIFVFKTFTDNCAHDFYLSLRFEIHLIAQTVNLNRYWHLNTFTFPQSFIQNAWLLVFAIRNEEEKNTFKRSTTIGWHTCRCRNPVETTVNHRVLFLFTLFAPWSCTFFLFWFMFFTYFFSHTHIITNT